MNPYFRLMRLDKPIGIYLLLYPTLWALMLAGAEIKEYIIFVLGVVLMRSGGCVINDFADRKIDRLVQRTKNRPLTTKTISNKSALVLFGFLMLLAFILVLFTNALTISLAFIAIFFAVLYPFTKRFFPIPQLFLGVAFAMSVPMSFATVLGFVPLSAWVLFLATIVWTVAYDSIYALVDIEDDRKIGVKSSAIFFGRFVKINIIILQIIFILLLIIIGLSFNLSYPYFLSIFFATILLVYQYILIKDKNQYFKAFLHNNYIGLVITIGIFF